MSDKTREELIAEVNELTTKIEAIETTKDQMKETNTLLRNILESSSSISIISTDLESNVLYWNVGAEKIFGYKADEIVGKKIDVLYAEEDSKQMKEEIRSFIFENKKGMTCEIREMTKDGRKIWIRMTLTPRIDDNGKLIGIFGIGEDITEKKAAEEELQNVI